MSQKILNPEQYDELWNRDIFTYPNNEVQLFNSFLINPQTQEYPDSPLYNHLDNKLKKLGYEGFDYKDREYRKNFTIGDNSHEDKRFNLYRTQIADIFSYLSGSENITSIHKNQIINSTAEHLLEQEQFIAQGLPKNISNEHKKEINQEYTKLLTHEKGYFNATRESMQKEIDRHEQNLSDGLWAQGFDQFMQSIGTGFDVTGQTFENYLTNPFIPVGKYGKIPLSETADINYSDFFQKISETIDEEGVETNLSGVYGLTPEQYKAEFGHAILSPATFLRDPKFFMNQVMKTLLSTPTSIVGGTFNTIGGALTLGTGGVGAPVGVPLIVTGTGISSGGGFLAEGGSTAEELVGLFSDLRNQAKQQREMINNGQSKMTEEEFKNKYTVYSGFKTEKQTTADKITDDQIGEIAYNVGLQYGTMSALIEAVSSGAEAVGGGFATNSMKGILKLFTKSNAGKVGQKATAHHWFKLAMQRIQKQKGLKKGAVALSTWSINAIQEGITEGVQESLNMSMVNNYMPEHLKTLDDAFNNRVDEAFRAGFVTGGVMRVGTTALDVGARGTLKALGYKDINESIIDNIIAEDADKHNKFLTNDNFEKGLTVDELDTMVRLNLFMGKDPYENVDKSILENYDTKELEMRVVERQIKDAEIGFFKGIDGSEKLTSILKTKEMKNAMDKMQISISNIMDSKLGNYLQEGKQGFNQLAQIFGEENAKRIMKEYGMDIGLDDQTDETNTYSDDIKEVDTIDANYDSADLDFNNQINEVNEELEEHYDVSKDNRKKDLETQRKNNAKDKIKRQNVRQQLENPVNEETIQKLDGKNDPSIISKLNMTGVAQKKLGLLNERGTVFNLQVIEKGEKINPKTNQRETVYITKWSPQTLELNPSNTNKKERFEIFESSIAKANTINKATGKRQPWVKKTTQNMDEVLQTSKEIDIQQAKDRRKKKVKEKKEKPITRDEVNHAMDVALGLESEHTPSKKEVSTEKPPSKKEVVPPKKEDKISKKDKKSKLMEGVTGVRGKPPKTIDDVEPVETKDDVEPKIVSDEPQQELFNKFINDFNNSKFEFDNNGQLTANSKKLLKDLQNIYNDLDKNKYLFRYKNHKEIVGFIQNMLNINVIPKDSTSKGRKSYFLRKELFPMLANIGDTLSKLKIEDGGGEVTLQISGKKGIKEQGEVLGVYFDTKNKIEIFLGRLFDNQQSFADSIHNLQETLVHEYIHYITSASLKNPEIQNTKEYKDVIKLYKKTKEFWNKTKNDLKKKDIILYKRLSNALENDTPIEFFSYFFTESTVQAYFSKQILPDSEVSLFQQIKDFFYNLFLKIGKLFDKTNKFQSMIEDQKFDNKFRKSMLYQMFGTMNNYVDKITDYYENKLILYDQQSASQNIISNAVSMLVNDFNVDYTTQNNELYRLNLGINRGRRDIEKTNRIFENAWMHLVNSTMISRDYFPAFAEHFSKDLINPDLKKSFDEWSSTYNYKADKNYSIIEDNKDKIDELANNIFGVSVHDELELATSSFVEYIKEGIGYSENLEALEAGIGDNPVHIQNAFLNEFGIIQSNVLALKLKDTVENSKSFEDFVSTISSKKFIQENNFRINRTGTIEDIITKNKFSKTVALRYWSSNRPENKKIIHSPEHKENVANIIVYKKFKEYQIILKDKNEKDNKLKIFKYKVLPAEEKKRLVEKLGIFKSDELVYLSDADIFHLVKDKDRRNQFGEPIFYTDNYSLDLSDYKNGLYKSFFQNNLIPIANLGDSQMQVLFNLNSAEGKRLQEIVNSNSTRTYWEDEAIYDEAEGSIGANTLNSYLLNDKRNYYTTKEGLKEIQNLTGINQQNLPSAFRRLLLFNIVRHETYKKIFGENYYHNDSNKIFQRLKIPFTPSTTNSSMPTRKVMVFNPVTTNDSKVQLHIINKANQTRKIDLIKTIDGKEQYVLDGMSLTSDKVFKLDYPKYLATQTRANRAKTAWYHKDEKGVIAIKHEEMSPILLDSDKEGQFVEVNKDGTKTIIATYKRDLNGYVNLYDAEGNYFDMLNTPDETKIQTGEYNRTNQILELPGGSVGLIHNPYDKTKTKGKFSPQRSNFITDPKIIKALNDLFNDQDKSRTQSAYNQIQRLKKLVNNPKELDKFILEHFAMFIGGYESEMRANAELGAGFHPSQLANAKLLIKNEIFDRIGAFETYGTYLHFRMDTIGNPNNEGKPLTDDEVVMPYDHQFIENIKKMINVKYATKKQLNDWLKRNEVYVMGIRSPVGRKTNTRIMRVVAVEDIGDTFIVSHDVVKSVFEGDGDGDTASIVLLDNKIKKLSRLFKKEQDDFGDVKDLGLGLEENLQPSNIGNIDQFLQIYDNIKVGKKALGGIANFLKHIGMLNTWFESIEAYAPEKTILDGQQLKEDTFLNLRLRDLNEVVYNEEMRENIKLELMGSKYLQASVDHIKLGLLNDWQWEEKGLKKLMSYYFVGSGDTSIELSSDQFALLKYLLIKPMNDISSLQKGRDVGTRSNLTFDDYFEYSARVKEHIENRLVEENEEGVPVETKGTKSPRIFSLKGKKGVQNLYENIAVTYDNLLSKEGITQTAFNLGFEQQRFIHREGINNVADKILQNIVDQYLQDENKTTKDIRAGEIENHLRNAGILAQQLSSRLERWTSTRNSKFRKKSESNINQQMWNTDPELNEIYQEFIEQTADLSKSQRMYMTYKYLSDSVNEQYGKTKDAINIIPPSRENVDAILDPSVLRSYYTSWNDLFLKIINADENELAKIFEPKNKFAKIVIKAEKRLRQTLKDKGCIV